MPIHFRCPHCQQLMGIARRKAGAMIHCPTCTKQLRVPSASEDAPPEGPRPSEPRPNSLLEKIDVDAILNPAATDRGAAALHAEKSGRGPMAVAPSPSRPAASAASRAAEDRRVDQASRSDGPSPARRVHDMELPSLSLGLSGRGVFLSPAKITVLSVVGVVLLGLAFLLGLIVGRSM